MILAGDVGGTKTQLALFRPEGPLKPRAFRLYATREFRSPVALLKHYLAETGVSPQVVSLAVAGTVLRGRVHMVNVGWRFSERSLASALGVSRVHLLNDLEALAFAVPHLRRESLVQIKDGRREAGGNIAILAAGTGLGESFLIRKRAASPVPVATEGGHAEFFALDETTWRLRLYLQEKYGHVSLERVISGPGIENIYRFLCQEERREPAFSSAKEIGEAGLKGEPLARRALEIFVRLYAAEAGNSALRCLATGGVFIGGGIAPKLLPLMDSDLFRESFLDKGRFREFLAQIPVWVVTHPHPVLLGAALFARSS
ncbi:MAG: glucokinase [Thermodesulfobacteria bacterium]|nr:glucokinase [Thermodesulfobacteriota bacterium]